MSHTLLEEAKRNLLDYTADLYESSRPSYHAELVSDILHITKPSIEGKPWKSVPPAGN